MAWNSPVTAIAGQVVAAADFNTYIRDNLNLTEAALAQDPGGFFVTTGFRSIAQRIFTTDVVDVAETTTSTSYTDLATFGPSVTVATGTHALVIHGARIGDNTNTGGNPSTTTAVAVSGATTIAADVSRAAGIIQQSALGRQVALYTSRWWLYDNLNAGNNTFTMKYATTSGTTSFDHRSLHVLPL